MLGVALVPAVVVAGVYNHVGDKHWSNKYDHHFRKYAKHYFGAGFEWRWFKAQGIAESGLNPQAKSPAGARGIMQILPSTFQEIREKNPHYKSIDDPHWNIAAAIYYNRQLYRRWRKKMPDTERLPMTFASYNAGYSKVYRAYDRAIRKQANVREWAQVAPYTPAETRHYVRRIQRLMQVP